MSSRLRPPVGRPAVAAEPARRGRRRALLIVAVLALMPVFGGNPAEAEDGPVPASCKTHPVHVVNPGCVPAVEDSVHATAEPVVDAVLGEPETLPDLVPDVTYVAALQPILGFENGTILWGPTQLFFDTWSMNVGAVPLDLVSDDLTNLENPTASQCVSWNPNLVCRERRQVGGFEVHPTHGHFHYSDFARYELRHLLTDGTPDYSAAGLIDISDKVSFCLVDSAPTRDDARPVGTYNHCSGTREGISEGWADIYSGELDGQQLDIAGLPDGRYGLVISMDPADHLYETNDGNNVVEVTVEISGNGTTVAIVGKRRP